MAPEFSLIALTLPGSCAPAVAIAASRAGALGVLDLEYVPDAQEALNAVTELVRQARSTSGVRLALPAADAADDLLPRLPDAVGVVLLSPAGCPPDELARQVEALHRRSRQVLLEVTSLAEARLGQDVGVDGLVAKGNEAGGRVGDMTSFVLLQQVLAETPLAVWSQGGIGLHTAGARYAAGARGVVLDVQLALTRESPTPEALRTALRTMDGSETVCVGGGLGAQYRVYHRPGLAVVPELRAREATLAETGNPTGAWRADVAARVGWDAHRLWLIGQDGAFARVLADRFRTVAGVLNGIREAVDSSVRIARRLRPLDEGSPLARSHGTRYPIVQGPMTRVSDTAAFAERGRRRRGTAVPRAGPDARARGRGAARRRPDALLGDRPWGVGILGFVPPELREEQLAVIRAHRPPFALIAGGRPDQALALERDGIPTYLHVPSPGCCACSSTTGPAGSSSRAASAAATSGRGPASCSGTR